MTLTPNLERDAGSQVEPAPAEPPSARNSVRGARVLIGALALLLLAPTLLSIRGGTDAVENRKPVPFPPLDSSTVLDTTAYRQVDAALRDRLILRRQVAKTVGAAGYDGLAVSLNSQVHVGEDGVPFLTDEFTKPCHTAFDAARVDARLRSWEQLARRSGKDVLFVVVPDKSTVMRDELGWQADELMACADPPREQSQARWGGDPTGPVLTLWPQFAAVEEATPGQLFQYGDSHWSDQGSIMFTREVVDRLVARGQAPTQLRGAPGAVQLPDKRVEGDLYRLLGMTRADTVPNWAVRRAGVTVTSSSTPSPTGRGVRTRTVTAPAGTPLVPGRTLVVHDSFYNNADRQMAPYFAQTTVLHWDDFLPMARDGKLPGFDRVIFETAQRGWPQRIVDQLPDPAVTAALTRELGTPASVNR
ncbi:MAG TPA: hypothetical protein VGD43_14105 [Micromonospora sp.]